MAPVTKLIINFTDRALDHGRTMSLEYVRKGLVCMQDRDVFCYETHMIEMPNYENENTTDMFRKMSLKNWVDHVLELNHI